MMIMQVLLAFIIVVVVQVLIYRYFAFRGFSYTCTLLRSRVYEGEMTEMLEVIENRKLLPLLWVKIETRFSETFLFAKNNETRVWAGVFHRSVLTAPPLRRIKRTYKIVCTKRGYYPVGSASVTTGDLFGLSSYPGSYSSDAGVHVCPTPLHRTEFNLPSRSFLGDVVVRRYFLPDPFMPSGIRNYSPSDPLKLINWKATAKTGNLVVHRNDFTANSNLLVFFNIDYSATYWDMGDTEKAHTMENAIRILATILDISIQSGQQTALRTNAVSLKDGSEVSVPSAVGSMHRDALYMAMAEIQFVRSRNFHMLLRESVETVRDSDVLLMTKYMTKEISVEIENLRLAGNKVEVLELPDAVNAQSSAGGDISE